MESYSSCKLPSNNHYITLYNATQVDITAFITLIYLYRLFHLKALREFYVKHRGLVEREGDMTEQFLLSVDPQRIRFNPLNPRKHQGIELDRLRTSIQRYGILQPPIVRSLPGNLFETIDGEGRIFVGIELGLKEIQVINIGLVKIEDALLLLQVSNTIRNFNLLAECKGLANLHRQEISMTILAKEFGYSLLKTQEMIHIGHMPDDLLVTLQKDIATSEDHARLWTLSLLASALALRELLPGQTSIRGSIWSSLDEVYDYAEVRTALQKVLEGKITTVQEMKLYVANRRYEIYQTRFDAALEQKLQEELTKAKEELNAAKGREHAELEMAKNEEILSVQTELRDQYEGQIITLGAQLESLAKSHKRIMSEAAKQPEHIAKQEKKLREDIEQTEIERQKLRALQRQVEEETKQARLKQEREARKERERWEEEKGEKLHNALLAQRERQREELEQAEKNLKNVYLQKEQKNKIEAENTIHGLLSRGIKSLAETQQVIDHIVSSSMLQPVRELGGAHHESLLWAIRSMSEALDRAEKKLVDGDVPTYVEGGLVNGYQQTNSEYFPK
jgi:ParB-like chromosome segregation protein Spo0J